MRTSLIVFLLIIPNPAEGTNWIHLKRPSIYKPILSVPKFRPGGFLKPLPRPLPFVHRQFSVVPFRKLFWKPVKGHLNVAPIIQRKPLFRQIRPIFNPLPWKFRKPCKALWRCRSYEETFSFPKYGKPRVRPFVFSRQLPLIRPRPSFRPVPTLRLAPRLNTAPKFRPETENNHHQSYTEVSGNGYIENRNFGNNNNNFGNNNNNDFIQTNNLGNGNNFGNSNSNLGHNINNLGNNNFESSNINNFRSNNNNNFGNNINNLESSNNNNFRNRNNNNNFGNSINSLGISNNNNFRNRNNNNNFRNSNNNLEPHSLGNNPVDISHLNSNDFHTHGQDVYVRVQSLHSNANNNVNNNNNNFNGA